MAKEIINTTNAPQAIGPYSQAVKVDNHVYISGQIPLVPETMKLINEDITDQVKQVFNNLSAVASAAGGTLQDIVKLNVYLTDLSQFETINKLMTEYFTEPFPARAAIGVASLPKNAQVEIDAIMILPSH